MNPLRTRAGKVAVAVAAALGISLAAFAVVAISTDNITGSTGVSTGTANLTVVSVVTTQGQGGLACLGKSDGAGVDVSMTARKFNGAIAAQDCRVTARVQNNGNQAVKLTDFVVNSGQGSLAGWRITPQTADPIVPAGGEVRDFSAVIATGGPQVTDVGQGAFTAQIKGEAQG